MAQTTKVNLLIDEYKRMEKMVNKMGKSGLFGKGPVAQWLSLKQENHDNI